MTDTIEKKVRMFNIMQYVEHPKTKEFLLGEKRIIEAVSKKNIDRFAYVLHDKDKEVKVGDDGLETIREKPAHWHIVVSTKAPVTAREVGAWFNVPANFVDIPRGGKRAFFDCVRYLTHESKKEQDAGKYQYRDEEIKANFDFRTFINDKLAKMSKKDTKEMSVGERMIFDVMYNGLTLKQAREMDDITFMRNHKRIENARGYYLSECKPPEIRLNYYISGGGGVGKGTISKALARNLFPHLKDDSEIFFEVGSGNVTFEGYDGQPVIIWNDVRAGDLIKILGSRGNVFDVFDTHPTARKQNVKYGSTTLLNQYNIVNSVQSIIEFLHSLAGEYTDSRGNTYKAEDINQVYRRFQGLIPLRAEEFDLLYNKGFMEGTDRYSEYVAYKDIIGNFATVRNKLSGQPEKIKEIETNMTKKIITINQQMIESKKSTREGTDEVDFEKYGELRDSQPSEYNPANLLPAKDEREVNEVNEEDKFQGTQLTMLETIVDFDNYVIETIEEEA